MSKVKLFEISTYIVLDECKIYSNHIAAGVDIQDARRNLRKRLGSHTYTDGPFDEVTEIDGYAVRVDNQSNEDKDINRLDCSNKRTTGSERISFKNTDVTALYGDI